MIRKRASAIAFADRALSATLPAPAASTTHFNPTAVRRTAFDTTAFDTPE
jgi:hypothetical protein